jgi:hypothetical protein
MTADRLWANQNVLESLAGHCCRSHQSANTVRACDYCQQLVGAIAEALQPPPDPPAPTLFPIQGGPAIPWSVIAPHELQAQRNHDQSLQRLAERGGLSPCEAVAVLEGRAWHRMDKAAALLRLRELSAPPAPTLRALIEQKIEQWREKATGYAKRYGDADAEAWNTFVATRMGALQDCADELAALLTETDGPAPQKEQP